MAVFETVCVGTRFSDLGFVEAIKVFEQSKQLTEAQLRASGDGKVGFQVISGGEPYFVKYGEKQDGEFLSRSCGITFRWEFRDVIEIVGPAYKLEIVSRERQGVSDFALFVTDLIGYPEKVAFSVQAGAGVVALSMYEFQQ